MGQDASDKRLRELEEANRRRQIEATKIQKEFETAERVYKFETTRIRKEFQTAERQHFRALKRLEELETADLEEIQLIEESRKQAREEQKEEIVEATNILTAFLDPSSASGSQLDMPPHIWNAIIELSKFLKGQDLDTSKRLKDAMNSLVVKAEEKVRGAKAAAAFARSAALTKKAAAPKKKSEKVSRSAA